MMTFADILVHPLFALSVATFLSVFFYRRTKRIKRFSYEQQQSEVIGSDHRKESVKLKVLYDGAVVPCITRSLVRFWNSGHETIRGADIASADPLRWQLSESTKVLACSVERCSRAPIGVIATEGDYDNSPCIFLSFDFLDSGDGAIVSILHTDRPSSASLKGTVQGIPNGLSYWGSALNLDSALSAREAKSPYSRMGSLTYKYASFALLVGIGVFALICLIFPDAVLRYFPSMGEPDTSDMLVPGRMNWRYGFFAAIFLSISFLLARVWWRRPPKGLQ